MSGDLKSRTLFISYEGIVGGAGRLLLDIIPGLDTPPLIACPPSALAERAGNLGFEVAPLRARRVEMRASPADRLAAPLRLADLAREIRELVRLERPSAVIAWGMRAALSSAAALASSRHAPPFAFQQNDLIPGPLIRRAVDAAARRADLVFAPSAEVARDTDPDGVLGDRLLVLAPGVDLARFVPVPLPAAPLTALLLGALVPAKRPELALEIVALASRELPDLRLTVVGPELPDPAGQALVRVVRERASAPDLAGRVTFSGPVDDPRSALRASHCLLHCRDREPFGIVILEALASGRPVVAPAGGGPAEVLDDSCGRLYPQGDAATAAHALVTVLGNRERLIGLSEGARRRAEEYSLPAARARFAEAIAALERGTSAPADRRRFRRLGGVRA